MRTAVLGLSLFLVGCAGGSQPCVTVKEISPSEQSALAAALADIPADSPIFTAMGDYGRMRAESRVCQLIAK